jgi:hypothetical protein
MRARRIHKALSHFAADVTPRYRRDTIEFKEDKQGFGMTKRSKKKFAARTVGDAARSVGAQRRGVGAPVVE